MSGSSPKAPSGEPTMEEILASIRQIISEGDKPTEVSLTGDTTRPAPLPAESMRSASPKPTPTMTASSAVEESHTSPEDGVLVLDPGMLISEGDTGYDNAAVTNPAQHPADAFAHPASAQDITPMPLNDHYTTMSAADDIDLGLVAPTVAATAASSLDALARAVSEQRHARVERSGGISIEDVVREEVRPLLKAWLEAHLPETVERLVKAEIERVVGRMRG